MTGPDIRSSSQPFLRRCRLGDQFKILHHLTDRDSKLMRIDDTGEVLMLGQQSCSLMEKIIILREELDQVLSPPH